MAKKAPPEQTRFVAPLFQLDPAAAEFLIVARQLKSGSYQLMARAVTLRPFVVRSYQLGNLDSTDPHARTPWQASMWAASLYSVDEEIQSLYAVR